MNQTFHYESGGRPTSRMVSGTTVYEECLHNGRYIGLYWSSSGQVHRENTVERIPARPLDAVWQRLNSFEFETDGQTLDSRWAYNNGYMRTDAKKIPESVVELKHRIRPVTVKVVTKLDGTPVLSRYLEITNTGERPAALGCMRPFAGRLWDNLWQPLRGDVIKLRTPYPIQEHPLYSIGYYKSAVHDASMFGMEGNFTWEPIRDEYYTVSRLERHPYGGPFFVIRNNLTGECFFIALAWSAGFELKLWNDVRNCSLNVTVGPAGPAPLRVISPGETVVTPAVHIGPMHGSFDGMVRDWYAHLRTSVLPKRPVGKEMYTIAGRVVECPGDWILREIDIAADMGAEAFLVDAGWYGDKFAGWGANRGDWYEGDFLPDGGLLTIRDYTHAKGMLFGLWMEPEAVSTISNLYNNHADWCIAYNGESGISAGSDGVLNLANPEAAAFFKDTVLRIIGENKLDFFKLDYNMRIVEGGRYDVDGYAENQAWRHFEVLYDTFEEVLEKYPDVTLENCASGGGRNDLGMLSRFHFASQSDWSCFPYAIRAINGMTLFLPPETLCYYHNHLTFACQMTELDTHLRVALFCAPVFVGYGGQDTDRTGVYYEKTRQYTNLLKTFCRPIMIKASVYHHTPDIGVNEPTQWCVLEYAEQNRESGYIGLFRLGFDKSYDVFELTVRGADPVRMYEVTYHNSGAAFIISGAELTTRAVAIQLSNVNTSELVLYKAVD